MNGNIKLVTSVPEVTTHCLDPITEQVVHKFIDTLGLKAVFKNNIHINSDHSAASRTTDESHNPKLIDNKFTCITTPILNPINVKWPVANTNTFVGAGQSLSNMYNISSVYTDQKAHANLVEHLVPCSIDMDVTMSFKDRSVGYEVASRLHNTYRNGEITLPTDLIYDYPIPRDVYTILYVIYKLRGLDLIVKENGKPYTFFEYLRERSNNKVSINVNRNTARNSNELIIQTSCYNCLMSVDYTQDKPDANKTNQSTDNYEITCSITIQFSRVDMLYLDYPIVINNQLIPASAIPYDLTTKYKTTQPVSPFIDLRNYQSSTKIPTIVETLQFPIYDNWKVPPFSGFKQLHYEEFYIGVLTLDLDLPSTDIDLTGDLGDGMGLKTEVIDALKELGAAALRPYGNYAICVFVGEILIEPSSMTLSDDLLLSIPNREVDRMYRLVISTTHDIFSDTLQSARYGIWDIVVNKK